MSDEDFYIVKRSDLVTESFFFFVSMLFALSGFYLFYKIKDEKGLGTAWEVA